MRAAVKNTLRNRKAAANPASLRTVIREARRIVRAPYAVVPLTVGATVPDPVGGGLTSFRVVRVHARGAVLESTNIQTPHGDMSVKFTKLDGTGASRFRLSVGLITQFIITGAGRDLFTATMNGLGEWRMYHPRVQYGTALYTYIWNAMGAS
jgi:hypothetical protein